MDIISTTNLSIRELRRYRTLYRSRSLLTARSSVAISEAGSLSKILLNISRGAISPNNRVTLRKTLSKRFPASEIKLTLLPTSLSQLQNVPSPLRNVRALLKGSSFQRQVTFKVPSGITSEDERHTYTKGQRHALLETIKKLNLASFEGGTFTRNPSLIISPVVKGAYTPLRFTQTANIVAKRESYKEVLCFQLAQITKPTTNCYTTIGTPLLAVISPLKAAHYQILFALLWKK